MRKPLLFLLATFLFLSKGYAQDDIFSKENDTNYKSTSTYLSLSGGYVSSMLQGTLIENELKFWSGTKSVREPGYVLNLGIKQELAANVFLKSGLLLLKRSGRVYASPYKYPTKAGGVYVSIPVLLGLQTNWLSDRIRIGVEAGGLWNLSYREDIYNLTAGLNENAMTSVQYYDRTRSFMTALNAEIKASEDISFFVNYSFVKDLSPFFSRRITSGDGTISYRSDLFSGGIMLKIVD